MAGFDLDDGRGRQRCIRRRHTVADPEARLLVRAGGPLARFMVTTTGQRTAERGTEASYLLAGLRGGPAERTDALFGPNPTRAAAAGTFIVGAPVGVGLSWVRVTGRAVASLRQVWGVLRDRPDTTAIRGRS